MEPASLFLTLPKAELHVHLEGCVEPETYFALARRSGTPIRYGSVNDLKLRLRQIVDFATFIEVYEELLQILRTGDDFRDVAMSYFERAHAQNVIYAEVSFDPQMHLERGITLGVMLEALRSARVEARRRWGLEARYIMCFNRDRSAESARAILEESLPWRDHFIGIGLDNREELGFPAKFQGVFQRAHALGLRLTSHCGIRQPNTLPHFWGCLEQLNVERIDHGLDVLDDPRLVKIVREKKIGLTACPTVFHTHVPGLLEFCGTAIRRMLEENLLVMINSDDPALMRSGYVGDVLRLMLETVPLTREQVLTLIRNSFIVAWLSDSEREHYLAQVDDCARQNLSGTPGRPLARHPG